jgi:hypothetical protein
MISRAIVQSAIVLMNRRMKVERGVITFVPVCSSVEDMHLHNLEGRNQAQAQISVCGKAERVVLNALAEEMRLARLFLNPFRELSRETKVLD